MGLENANLAPNQAVWNMETGPSAARGGSATLAQVFTAFSDAQFITLARRDANLSAAMRELRTDGATISEMHAFDRHLHNVPGALNAFERALERVAPHLLGN